MGFSCLQLAPAHFSLRFVPIVHATSKKWQNCPKRLTHVQQGMPGTEHTVSMQISAALAGAISQAWRLHDSRGHVEAHKAVTHHQTPLWEVLLVREVRAAAAALRLKLLMGQGLVLVRAQVQVLELEPIPADGGLPAGVTEVREIVKTTAVEPSQFISRSGLGMQAEERKRGDWKTAA